MSKFLDFTKAHPVEDSNFGWIIQENGEALSIPFELFFKNIILVDNRWGKSMKSLSMLLDIRDKLKPLCYNDSNNQKILELTDEEWALCCEISNDPAVGYSVQYCTALFAHVKDLKEARSIKPELA